MTKWTPEEIIRQIKIAHPDKCDDKTFERFEFQGMRIKATFYCVVHGWFDTRPESLINGHWCKLCGMEKSVNAMVSSRRSDAEEFISKVIVKHKDRVDQNTFLDLEYKTARIPVVLRCKTHGRFKILPYNVLNAKEDRWCPECGEEIRIEKCTSNRLTTEIFINKVKKIHLDKINEFTFEKTVYGQNNEEPVWLFCKEHGDFKITPSYCLSGGWCRTCSHNVSKLEIRWLNKLHLPQKCRQITLYVGDKKFRADAFSKKTNTVYEFLGDYWHGNPEVFERDELNSQNKKSFGQLYDKTINKINDLRLSGFNVIYVWENDFNNGLLKSEGI